VSDGRSLVRENILWLGPFGARPFGKPDPLAPQPRSELGFPQDSSFGVGQDGRSGAVRWRTKVIAHILVP
jgi:hypothetical protein